jgi:hypothetical protein
MEPAANIAYYDQIITFVDMYFSSVILLPNVCLDFYEYDIGLLVVQIVLFLVLTYMSTWTFFMKLFRLQSFVT